MCKKIAIVVVALVAGLVLLNKTSLGSYVGFSWKKSKDYFQKQVPHEIELERLRHEVTQLDPEIKRARSTLAEESVAVDMLREDVDRTQANLKTRLTEILALRKDLDSGATTLTVTGRSVPATTVRNRVAADWESYKRAEEGQKSKEKLLEAREAALADGRAQLAGMSDLKAQLSGELDQLEAELKTVRLAQTRHNIQLDNTRLTRFNTSLTELKRRVKVEQRLVEMEAGAVKHTATFEKSADVADKALKEIDERFGKVAAER